MIRCAALAALLALSGCIAVPVDASLCTAPDVLQYYQDHYLAGQPNAEILTDTVVAYPTADPRQLQCLVYVRREVFDYARFGHWPQVVEDPETFLVRRAGTGFELTRPAPRS